MEKINPHIETTLKCMIYGALLALAIGLLTSPTILSLSHILMAVPAFYFLSKVNYKSFPKSSWALLALTIVIIFSVLFNQDIAIKGYKPVFKAKYFLFGFISLAPLSWFFKNHVNDKKISTILYFFCFATTLATICGLIKFFSGYNVLNLTVVGEQTRNGGFFGMLMNYAHNMSYFLIIILGLLYYKTESKKYINLKFLLTIFIINLFGFYATYTRGAWLGFLVGFPFFFFKQNKKWFGLAVATGIVLGAIVYLLAGKAMYRKDYDASRLGQWQASIAAFKERPVFGYGYLNFEEHSSKIKEKYNLLAPEFKGHAHNNFFEMLASTGATGFILFIAWAGLWFMEMLKRSDLAARIGLPFIVVFIVGGLTQSTISLGINLFFILGVYSLTSMAQIEMTTNQKA